MEISLMESLREMENTYMTMMNIMKANLKKD